jgi:hypothetical protein
MPSTYTTNGGIELPANGEQSGTWGETVNDNMAIIDRLTNGVGAISLSGTTHTLTTADGTLSDGQYNVLVLGGSPSGTNTITISPNDGEHVYVVKNASGQTATFTQGSGASISVLNNTTKIIYADGAGAGAAVVDITGALDLGSLIIAGTTIITAVLDEDNMASDSATALATQQSIKAYVDAQVDTVDTLAEILAIGNTTGGTDIVASTTDKVQFRDAAIYINSSVDGQLDIVADTEIQIAATTVDLNGNLDVSGTALVTGVLTTTAATVHTGGITMPDNAKAIFGAGSDLQIYHATATNDSIIDEGGTGNLSLQGTNVVIKTSGGSATQAHFYAGAEVALYYNNAAKLATTATGIDVTGTVVADGLTVDSTITLGQEGVYDAFINSPESLYINIDSDGTQTGRKFQVGTNSTGVSTTKILTASDNGDISFYEATGTTAKFFWDASAESLGIGTTPATKLDVLGSINSGVRVSDGTATGIIYASSEATNSIVVGTTTNHPLVLYTNNAARMTIDSSGKIGIGAASVVGLLQIKYATDVHTSFRNATAGGLSAGTLIESVNDAFNSYNPIYLKGSQFTFGTDAGGTFVERLSIDSSGGLITNPSAGGHAVFNEAGVDADFRVESDTNANMLTVDASVSSVGIGKFDTDSFSKGAYFNDSAGNFFHQVNTHTSTTSAHSLLYLNRQSSDGDLVEFRQADSAEGTISVSGSTVSYNGFSGRHESSGIPANTPVGTVVSTINELDVYPDNTTNIEGNIVPHKKAGQTRADHAKVEVSTSAGDPCVYGVVSEFNGDSKLIVTSVGVGSIRVTGACSKGDLLESNGDGTAKVQSDDIIRSKTIGKVTIGNSDTGVKLVACVMYCG